jgi:hypothetical protein
MSKHQVVLHWFESMNRNMRSFESIPSTGPQMFAAKETDPLSIVEGTVVRMEYDAWQDIGGPTTVRVTVEPTGERGPEALVP